MVKFINHNHSNCEVSREEVNAAYEKVLNRSGSGCEMLGWLDYPKQIDSVLEKIKAMSLDLQSKVKVLVVIGIGGSYLGTKALVDALKPYYGTLPWEIVFAGHNMSGTYLHDLIVYLENKDFAINVISKSGTTTEPAIAFRVLKQLLIQKHRDDYQKYIIATTDEKKGALFEEAKTNGYQTFVIPDHIGGRYSWITPVSLLPLSYLGYNIDELVRGAISCLNDYQKPNNLMLEYAKCRYNEYLNQKKIEILVTYEAKLSSLCEWWKQLFGESEGKDGKGIYPSSLIYSTDLHSLGQFVQDGTKLMFETVITVNTTNYDLVINPTSDNLDGLNYLADKSLNEINHQAYLATKYAHLNGGVPNFEIQIDEVDEYHLGYLLYFFMLSCATYCYLLGVNPFNQPGVEAYKTKMFELLGKPGYQK